MSVARYPKLHGLPSKLDHLVISLGSAIAVKLPGVADLADQIQIQIGNHDVIGVSTAFGHDLAAGIAEVDFGHRTHQSAKALQSRVD